MTQTQCRVLVHTICTDMNLVYLVVNKYSGYSKGNRGLCDLFKVMQLENNGAGTGSQVDLILWAFNLHVLALQPPIPAPRMLLPL